MTVQLFAQFFTHGRGNYPGPEEVFEFTGLFAVSLNLLPLADGFLRVMNRCAYFGVLSVALYYGSKICQTLLNHWLVIHSAGKEWREPIRFVSRILFAGLGDHTGSR